MCVRDRYVDDYFACLQPECVEHGMECFAELVRLMLGVPAASIKKLGFGSPLCVLGLSIEVSSRGLTCFPSQEKVTKWRSVINQAVEVGRLTSGAASKLAGGLSWGSQNMFRLLKAHRTFLKQSC